MSYPARKVNEKKKVVKLNAKKKKRKKNNKFKCFFCIFSIAQERITQMCKAACDYVMTTL